MFPNQKVEEVEVLKVPTWMDTFYITQPGEILLKSPNIKKDFLEVPTLKMSLDKYFK